VWSTAQKVYVEADRNWVPASTAIPFAYGHDSWTFDPAVVAAGNQNLLFLMTADDGLGHDMKIYKWSLSFEADPTTEMDSDLVRYTAFIGAYGSGSIMDALDTTAGVSSETTEANINGNAAISNGNVVLLRYLYEAGGSTDYGEADHQVIFEMWWRWE